MIEKLLYIGISLVATAALVSIIIIILRLRKRNNEIEIEKRALVIEKQNLLLDRNKLIKDQEDLRNAQILFQKEKEAKADLSKKTEKEVAIDLFLKFIEMESTFGYMKNNLASIDSKLVGVKNYSEELFSMKKEISDHLDSLREEMTALQKSYSTTLSTIYNELKVSLANIESHVESIVSSITEKEMGNLEEAVKSGLYQMENIVASKMAELSDIIDRRIANLSSEFEVAIEDNMPSSIDESDVEDAVKNVLNGYTFSDLDESDIERVVRSVMGDIFPYSFSFEDGIKSVVNSEVSSYLSDIKADISHLEHELSDIKSAIDSKG